MRLVYSTQVELSHLKRPLTHVLRKGMFADIYGLCVRDKGYFGIRLMGLFGRCGAGRSAEAGDDWQATTNDWLEVRWQGNTDEHGKLVGQWYAPHLNGRACLRRFDLALFKRVHKILNGMCDPQPGDLVEALKARLMKARDTEYWILRECFGGPYCMIGRERNDS